MKKILLASILSLLLGFANAQTFTSGGLKYKIVGQNQAVVSKNPNFSGDAIITDVVRDSVNVPYFVSAIVDSAFYGNIKITSIKIPSNITSIGKAAFFTCTGLKEVIDFNSVSVIQENTFAYCLNLTNINLSNVGAIKENAFIGCDQLKSINLNASLIGKNAFANCTGILTINARMAKPPLIDASVFAGLNRSLIELFVPGNSELAYDTIPIWTDFKIFSKEPFTFGDYNYITTTNSTVKFVGVYTFDITKVTIPATITRNNITYTVTSVAKNSLGNAPFVTSVTIPNSVKSIEANAFSYGQYLASVTLSNTLESIGDSAFMSTSLSSIVIPNSVKTIGKSVFQNCNSLGRVTLSNSLTRLPDRAFNQCRELKSITIPNSITEIGSEVFANCTALTTVNLSNTLKTIGIDAFRYCSNLQTIALPNTVTELNGGVFRYCSNLRTIALPNTVTKLNEGVFSYCTKLTTVTLSSSLQLISNNAFEYSGITTIEIPASVTTIEPTAFNNCTSLQSITVNSVVPLVVDLNLFNGLDKGNVILNVPAQSIQAYKTTAPWKFFNIPNPAFFTIEGINYGAINATEVEVKRHNTFSGAAVIPSSIIYFGKTYTVKQIADSAFTGTFINAITLPNGITSIGKYAFKNTYISKINLPTSLKSIGDGAFWFCVGINQITLPNGLTTIGKYAFNTTNISAITFPSSITSIGDSAFGDANISSVFAEWTTPIALNANVFKNITLSSVNLYVPDASKSLYASANVWKDFNAAVLTSITYEGILYNFNGTNTLTVGINTNFVGEAIIPNSFTFLSKNYTVTEIKDSAFFNCIELTKVVIPSTITKLGIRTFMNCSNLVSVSIPNSVTSIGLFSFGYCTSLQAMNIPSGVTTLASAVFYKCSSLITVSIPSTVTSIGTSAFALCSQLNTIYVNCFTPLTINANVFNLVDKVNAKLYVPYGRSSVYAAALVWKDFPIVENDKFTVNGINFQFTSGNTAVVSKNPTATGNVNIPSTVVYNGQTYKVTAIADSAFYGNKGLKSVTFSNKTITIARISVADTLSSLKTIGKHAFEGCDSLAVIEIPDSVVAIGDSAFAFCVGLTDVKVNWNTPLAINSSVFEGVNIANVNLFVPSGSTTTYSNAAVWKEFRIGIVSQLVDVSTQNNISVYPNPFANSVNVGLIDFDENSRLEILDLQGNIVQKTILNTMQNIISTENVSAGVYVFKIIRNSQVYFQKLMKY